MYCVRLIGLSAAFIALTFFTAPAFARHHHHYHHHYRQQQEQFSAVGNCALTNSGRQVCNGFAAQAFAPATEGGVSRRSHAAQVTDEGSIIGGRPGGCPNRYCGCGLRKYLGLADKRLNLASNWARFFPHVAGPAAGVAAVRSGHVMYIEASAGNGQWLVRDYNSGGGLSRLHIRDVRGYTFVNPHAVLASR